MQNKSTEELKIECLKLENLLQDFEFDKLTIEAVIKRETADKTARDRPVHNYGFGMRTQHAYEGYSLLIKAFMAMNADSLSEEKLEKLKKALETIGDLRQQTMDLEMLNAASYQHYKISEKARILAQLENEGEVYIRAGYGIGQARGHHAIVRYKKEDPTYYYPYSRTEFNEGDGVEFLSIFNPRQGWGVNKKPIRGDFLERVISMDVDTLFADAPSHIRFFLESRTQKDLEESLVIALQTVGNCSTRSIRALLRNIVGTELTRGLFDVATTEFTITKNQLAERLYEIRDELGKRGIAAEQASELGMQAAPIPRAEHQIGVEENVRDAKFRTLRDLIIIQAEQILQKPFEPTDALESFKNSVLRLLPLLAPGETSYWPYLSQQSLEKIAFIMAKTLIKKQIISIKESALTISPNLNDDTIMNKAMFEGIQKSTETRFYAEDELGMDEAISARAMSLSQSIVGSFNAENYEKVTAVMKTMLYQLAQPYKIDHIMLGIIEKHLHMAIADELPWHHNFRAFHLSSLEHIVTNHNRIIAATQKLLATEVQLQPFRKDLLSQPIAKPAVRKLYPDEARTSKLSAVLLKKEASRINNTLDKEDLVTPEFLTNAMEFAIENHDKALGDRLQTRGVDINTQSKSGRTLLINAAIAGNTNDVLALLELGANPTIKNRAGETALMIAIIQTGDRSDIIDKLATLDSLNVIDNQGKTALMHAVMKGNESYCRTLINAGADLEIRDKDNKTALMLAVEQGKLPLIQELLLSGANAKNIHLGGGSRIEKWSVNRIFDKYNANPVKWLVDNHATPAQVRKFVELNAEDLTPAMKQNAIIDLVRGGKFDMAVTILKASPDVDFLNDKKVIRVLNKVLAMEAIKGFEDAQVIEDTRFIMEKARAVYKPAEAKDNAEYQKLQKEHKTLEYYSKRNIRARMESDIVPPQIYR